MEFTTDLASVGEVPASVPVEDLGLVTATKEGQTIGKGKGACRGGADPVRGAGGLKQPVVELRLVGAAPRHGSDFLTAEVVGAAVINGLMALKRGFILDGDAMQISIVTHFVPYYFLRCSRL